MIKYTFKGKNDGNNLLILGSVHGDERAGSNAIEVLRDLIVKGEIEVQSGSITCIPYANHEAYLSNTRFIETNLNRVFNSKGSSKEEQIAQQIKKEIEKADFVLDLHTFGKGIEPFVFNDMPENDIVTKVIENLPIEYVMGGWVDLYEDSMEMDTIGYAKKLGKPGIIIECGHHLDPKATSSAYNYIVSTLSTLGYIPDLRFTNSKQSWITVDTIVRKQDGAVFTKDWENFDKIKKGELIGHINNSMLQAPYDGYIVLPNKEATTGAEWLYFGK